MRVLLSIFLLVSAITAKKYRADKINFIYEKAAHHLKEPKDLASIEKKFADFDKQYMEIKHSHGPSDDVLNKKLAQIDKQLFLILEEYGLDQTVQAFKEKMKSKNAWQLAEEEKPVFHETFDDEELQKLWDQARYGKFSDSELEVIHGELKEAETKKKLYEDRLTDLKKAPHENSLDHDHEAVEKQKLVKTSFKEYYEYMENIQKKITNEEYAPFTEQRAKTLWKKARDNLSGEQFFKIQSELKGFERLLRQITAHKNEIEAWEKSKSDNADEELFAEYEKLKARAKKLESYLDGKVGHSEL